MKAEEIVVPKNVGKTCTHRRPGSSVSTKGYVDDCILWFADTRTPVPMCPDYFDDWELDDPEAPTPKRRVEGE